MIVTASDKIYVPSRPAHLPSVSVITPGVKVSDYHPRLLVPTNLSASGYAMQVCGFPGPPPPSASESRIRSLVSPLPLLCHVICNAAPPHHMLTLAVNKATQCQGLGPRQYWPQPPGDSYLGAMSSYISPIRSSSEHRVYFLN